MGGATNHNRRQRTMKKSLEEIEKETREQCLHEPEYFLNTFEVNAQDEGYSDDEIEVYVSKNKLWKR
jgi:hypothetical protein